ncbi:hypothetical protein QWZ10_24560 [Paracoccus cavernae]|nr:hypothetical protein [Paracoccus cavernae]
MEDFRHDAGPDGANHAQLLKRFFDCAPRRKNCNIRFIMTDWIHSDRSMSRRHSYYAWNPRKDAET